VKQVLQDRNGLTVVRDVPPPPCTPGSLLVQNAYSAISSGTEGSRVALAQKSLLGKARDRPDLVREVIARARREGVRATYRAVSRKLGEETPVGYSSAGIVLEVGEAVSGFSPGDRVACAGGGHANHAEVVSVPSNLCAKVPDSVGLDVAALTTLAAVALHGVRLADVHIGDRVAVIGCGLIGQIAARLLGAAGAELFVLDVDKVRVEQALAGGAHHGFVVSGGVEDDVLAGADGIGMDQVVITATSSTNDPLLLAARVARDRAAVVLVGDVPILFPRDALYEKELSFRVSRSYGPGRNDPEYEERGLDYPIGFVRWTEKRNMEGVLDLLARDQIRLGDLIDEVRPVEDAARAYRRLGGPPESRPRGAIVLSYAPEAPVEVRLEPILVGVETPKPPSAAVGAKSPLRVALVGPGGFASRVLVPALERAGARLELVAGGSGPSAEKAHRSLGFARIAESEESAVTDPSVDVVVIATRHVSHAALATRALEAGKHVFCEKPLALTLDELEEVLSAAANSSGILAVGFNRRFSQPLRELKEFLENDTRPMVINYRVSAGAIAADHWVHDLSQGGGRALGEVCHFVDSLAFLTGSAIESVYAVGYGPPGVPLQSRDNLVVVLSFANNSVGSITYAAEGSVRVPKERLEAFSGSKTAVVDDYKRSRLFGPQGSKRVGRKQDKGHAQEIEAFLQGATRGEHPVPLAEIANVSLATLAIVESLRTSRPVRIVQTAVELLSE